MFSMYWRSEMMRDRDAGAYLVVRPFLEAGLSVNILGIPTRNALAIRSIFTNDTFRSPRSTPPM
jgi:hypothetical protein